MKMEEVKRIEQRIRELTEKLCSIDASFHEFKRKQEMINIDLKNKIDMKKRDVIMGKCIPD